MARMKIFNTLEPEAFESPPVFQQRGAQTLLHPAIAARRFDGELAHAHQQSLLPGGGGLLQGPPSMLRQTLSPADIEFVARQIGVNPGEVRQEAYGKETYARHQRWILSHFGCCRLMRRRRSSPPTKSQRWFACSSDPSWSCWKSSRC